MALVARLRAFPGFAATLDADSSGNWSSSDWPEVVPLLNERFNLNNGGPADPGGEFQVERAAKLLGVTTDAIEWHKRPPEDSIKGRTY